MLYACNLKEEEIADPGTNPLFEPFQKVGRQSTGCQLLLHFGQDGRRVVGIVGRGRKGIPGSHGVEDSGVTSLIEASYELLGLASFLTAGEKEARAWTFRKGMTALSSWESFTLTSRRLSSKPK